MGREFPPDAALLLAELELVWSSPASMLTGWTTSQSNFVIEYQRKICINKRFRMGFYAYMSHKISIKTANFDKTMKSFEHFRTDTLVNL